MAPMFCVFDDDDNELFLFLMKLIISQKYLFECKGCKFSLEKYENVLVIEIVW